MGGGPRLVLSFFFFYEMLKLTTTTVLYCSFPLLRALQLSLSFFRSLSCRSLGLYSTHLFLGS